jgi:hypothetical protein
MVFAVPVQRLADYLDLARYPLCFQSSARTGEQCRRGIEQGAGQSRCRGCIAYTHFAADEELCAAKLGTLGRHSSRVQGADQLLFSHCWLPAEVGGAGTETKAHYAFQWTGVINCAQIHHFEFRAEFAGKYADRGTTAGKIFHHLGCDRLGKGGDALGRHAMIGSKYANAYSIYARSLGALQRRQPDGGFLKPSQGAGWLGEVCLTRLGSLPGIVVRCDGRYL